MVRIMMDDDSIVEFNDYSDIPAYHGHKLIFFKRYGSYQGDWVMFSEKEGKVYFWQGGYGSCSGCDGFEGHFDYEDTSTQKHAEVFIYAYKPERSYLPEELNVSLIEEYIKEHAGYSLEDEPEGTAGKDAREVYEKILTLDN